MKKILILTAMVSIGITGTMLAQNAAQKQQHQRKTRAAAQQNANGRAQAVTDRMTQELQLSPEQQQKVYQLVLDNQQQTARSKEQIAKFNTALDLILTEPQKVQMAQLRTAKMRPDATAQRRQMDLQAAPAVRMSTTENKVEP